MLADKKKWFSQIPRLAVIGVSDWITNEARASILTSAKILTKIYNWVDLDVFNPIAANSLKEALCLTNKFVILGVSSGWSNAKGLDKFIALSAALPEEMKIVLVGNIKGAAKLPKNIIHIPETHNLYEMAKFYSIADVFLHLSLEESFGKVTAEALACGTPAIVVDSTANPELIDVGCGHILAKDVSIKDLLDSLYLVQKNGKVSYSEHCINSARKRFDKESRISDYIDLFEKILAYPKAINDCLSD